MTQLLDRLLKAHREAEDCRKKNATHRFHQEFKNEVTRVHRNGLTISQIQKATGIHVNTLCAWMESQAPTAAAIPIEWISDNRGNKAAILFPSGIRIELRKISGKLSLRPNSQNEKTNITNNENKRYVTIRWYMFR